MLRDFINACWFAFKWGLLAALLAAVGLGLYFYGRLNDEIRVRVQAKIATAYPHLSVTIRSAQLIDGQGIEVRGLSISDPRLTGAPAELAYFDEMLLCCQTSLSELLKHDPKISRIIIRRPRLQASRRPDDSWSLSQLMPLPKLSQNKAEVQLENAQFIVFDSQRNPPITYNFHDINLSLTPMGDPASPDTTTYQLSGALAADHIQQIQLTGQLNRTTGALDLNGVVSGIDICPELMAALPPDEAARLQPLTPLRGQANLQFHVWHDQAQAQPWQFDVAGELVSGRFDDTRLPQALADLQAKFHADNRGFQIGDLTTRNGPTALRLNARIDGYQPGAPMQIEGEALHLLVGPLWEPLLPAKLLEQWRKFQPAGEVNVKNAQAVFDGQHWQLQATVECLNVSLMYYRFPYRVEHGNGTLQLSCDPQTRQNHLTMNMVAFAGSRPIKIEGEFLNPGSEFTGGLTISGNSLPFDQSLYNAISAIQPKASEVVQSLHLGGGFNFRVDCLRDDPHSVNMHQHLQVDLDHCSLRYDRFPYPLYNVVGKLEMIDGQWAFRGLEGANQTGHVTCDGSVTPAGQGVSLSLEFQGHDIPLVEELRDALPARMQPIWNDMKPKGSFNLLKSDVSYTSADKQLKVSAAVQPVGETVSIDPTYFPYRLEKVQGTIAFNEDRAEFQNLRAEHDRTPISANGFCDHSSDGAWHLHFENINADHVRLDVDRDLMIALPARLRKAVVQLNPTGLISLHGMVDFWGQRPPLLPNGSPPAVLGDCRIVSQWQNMQFDIEQGTLHTGVEVQNIHGGGVFNGSYDPSRAEGQHLLTRGELNVDSITWNNFQFTGVAAPVYVDDRQVIVGSDAEPPQPGLAPRHLFAKCYGGTVEADANVLLDEPPRYNVQARVNKVDLNRFCIESVPGRQKLKGEVDASVRLTGSAAGLHTLNGDGQVQLTNADIYELPVMVSLLKVLNLKRPDTNAFTKSDVAFHVDGEHVILKNIEFSGDAISLVGEGEGNLNTDIDLKLRPIVGRSDMQLPAWKRLMGAASEQIMQIHVTGTLADPHPKREALPTINHALQTLQTGMQPQNHTLPPPPSTSLPPMVELPPGAQPLSEIQEAPLR